MFLQLDRHEKDNQTRTATAPNTKQQKQHNTNIRLSIQKKQENAEEILQDPKPRSNRNFSSSCLEQPPCVVGRPTANESAKSVSPWVHKMRKMLHAFETAGGRHLLIIWCPARISRPSSTAMLPPELRHAGSRWGATSRTGGPHCTTGASHGKANSAQPRIAVYSQGCPPPQVKCCLTTSAQEPSQIPQQDSSVPEKFVSQVLIRNLSWVYLLCLLLTCSEARPAPSWESTLKGELPPQASPSSPRRSEALPPLRWP